MLTARSTISSLARRLPLYQQLRLQRELSRLRRQIDSARPLNVVLGGGTTSYEGWIKTDMDTLDITRPESWSRLFRPATIDRMLAEHVFEHLSEDECHAAGASCYHYLKAGGLLRLAVPDGYRRDAAYVAESAPPKDGHKILFTVETLVPLLEQIGFHVTPLEYFDAAEMFHSQPWDERDGFIQRSLRFDAQQAFARDGMFYTSLIVDAKKS